MRQFRRIAIGEQSPHAVTVDIERDAAGQAVATVRWPSHDDAGADAARYPSVVEAIEAAEAAKILHGFSEVLVALQGDDLWRPEWGELGQGANHLSEAESFELARATEASRDA